jgi:flagellar biosynthesis protein FlhA
VTLLSGVKPAALALPFGILTLICLMIVPTPALLLDVFFVLNIALSVAILMAAMNAEKPLDFSAFPSVLLFATLLRLALNVASTRVVLVSGHEGGAAAGHVIEAFGAFLVGGNFAVGLFVFMILMIINMVVVTKGAGRVSEVSARFTLDALPGKQMAIDADLAAGLLTADEAKARRREVATEADFYGSMDGASKFVKGDAIAALLILGVNIIAGFCLGMISHGLSAGEAAEKYITLAVGDALVAQVPSLLLSIAAAVIVTRVSDSRDLAGQIGGQLANPGTWLPVAVILTAIGVIPAMPQTIFLPAAGLAFWLWHALSKRAARPPVTVEEVQEPADPGRIVLADVSDHTLVTIELGYGLVHLVDERRGSPLVARVTGVRKQLSQGFGFVVPQFRVRDSFDMPPTTTASCWAACRWAGHDPPRPDTGDRRGRSARGSQADRRGDGIDPSFGCPALWIDPAQRDHAIAEGFLTVDASTVIATQLNQLLGERPQALLGPDEVRAILDAVKEHASGLVETVYPQPLSLAALTRLLRALLEDGHSHRPPAADPVRAQPCGPADPGSRAPGRNAARGTGRPAGGPHLRPRRAPAGADAGCAAGSRDRPGADRSRDRPAGDRAGPRPLDRRAYRRPGCPARSPCAAAGAGGPAARAPNAGRAAEAARAIGAGPVDRRTAGGAADRGDRRHRCAPAASFPSRA